MRLCQAEPRSVATTCCQIPKTHQRWLFKNLSWILPFQMKQKRPISGPCASVHSACVYSRSGKADQRGSKATLSEYKKQKQNKKINFNLYAFFFFFYQACFYTTRKLWIGREAAEQGREFGSQLVEMRPHYSPQLQLYKSLQMLHQQTALQPLRIQSKRNETGKWLCSREVPRTEDFATVAGCCRVRLIFFLALIAEKTTHSIPGGLYLHCTRSSTKYWPSASGFDLRSLLSAVACITLSYLDTDWIIQDKCSSSSLIKLTLFGF